MSETEENQMEVENSQNDTSSSDEDDEEELRLTARAEELEKNLAVNKYDYDAHLELVELYRKLTDFKSMREAYTRFHECFPLTPKIWLAWIKDEISVCGQHEEIFKLFDEAVEDYLSTELWIEYAQYSIGVADLDKTRSILERGLTSAGLHCTEASLLWDTLRELEFAHLSLAEAGSENWKTQAARLAEVFRRQLSVPLINMETTYQEWRDWFSSLPDGTVDPKPVEWGYKKAIKTLEVYKPFEEKLLMVEENLEILRVFKEYIKQVEDPSAIMCLYERAVFRLCLNPEIWLDYCNYCFKLKEPALKVCNRALRNCTWSEDLWIMKLRVLELLGSSSIEIMNCFEDGVANVGGSSLELWLSYLEYSHRSKQAKEKLDKLFDQARHQFNFSTDPASKITKFYALCLSKRGDHQDSKKLWKAILQKPENRASSAVWLEYIDLERQFGVLGEVRGLYQRALRAVTDWPQYIADSWMMFERTFGSLEDVMACNSLCRSLVAQQPTEEPKSRKRKLQESVTTEVKRQKIKDKTVQEPTPTKKVPVERDPTKTVFISNLHPSVKEEQIKQIFPNAVNLEIVLDKKGNSRCFGYVQFSMEEEVMTALARDREPLDGRPIFISNCKPDKNERKVAFKYANTEESDKLFVRGLPLTKTKEDVEAIFKPYGAKEVRLVLHKSGQPKGLAYVQFENEQAAQKAMKATDQTKIDDHIISVAISAPPPKASASNKKPEPTRHSKTQLQIPSLMVPRSLQVKNKTSDSNNGNVAVKPKSNADFRNMLLKK